MPTPDTGSVTGPGSDLDRLPRRLSPSRAKDYLDCPRLFYQRTILGRPSPSTIATVRGTLAHTVFERIFDHPPAERTPEVAVGYLASAWAELTAGTVQVAGRGDAAERAAEYRALAPAGSEAEATLLATAETAVRRWFDVERPAAFTPHGLELPDGRLIDGRELHVEAPLLGDGATLHGFIDRLDRWVGASGAVHWSVSDYKTGRMPGEGKDYPPATQARIVDEAFFALKIYAVLVAEQLGVTVQRLRLVYPMVGSRDGVLTLPVTADLLAATRAQAVTLWRDILASATTGDWPCRGGFRCRDHDPVPVQQPAA